MKTEADTYVIGWGTGSVHSLMSEIDFENQEIIAEMIPAYGQYGYRVVKSKQWLAAISKRKDWELRQYFQFFHIKKPGKEVDAFSS